MYAQVSGLLLGSAVATLFALAPLKAHSQDSESPLQCKIQSPIVTCDVMQDGIDIQNVILNRGRCDSPIPTDQDRQRASDFRSKLSVDVRQALPSLMPQLLMLASITQCKVDMPDFPIENCLASLALLKEINNPIGSRNFGDKISFSTFGCQNLLEYTVNINGEEWTWKTR